MHSTKHYYKSSVYINSMKKIDTGDIVYIVVALIFILGIVVPAALHHYIR